MRTLNQALTQKVSNHKQVPTEVPKFSDSSRNPFLSMYVAQVKLNYIEKRKNTLRDQRNNLENQKRKAEMQKANINKQMEYNF